MGPGNRILVCEQSPELAEQLRRKLTAAGFWVDVANSARECLELLREREYAAMTCNLILPDQDGISLIRDLRAVGLDFPILAVSILEQEATPAPSAATDDEDPLQPDWVQKAAEQARVIFSIKSARYRSRDFRPRILHVEQDPFSAMLVSSALKDTADIVHAASLEEVEDAVFSRQFDLVLLNPVMADGSGENALHIIAGSRPDLPIVLHTHYGESEAQDDDLFPTTGPSDAESLGLIATIRTVMLHSMEVPARAQA